ncbi:MAG: polyprenyl synthetase family protein [Gammaproteobacteria bacterium]|nr:polyprenyl synthetase family protein [Gammaproteobacteria bacterium]
MKYYMPPEADEFLHLVKEEFARSFDIEESFISDWLKHHNESKGKWIRARLALASGGLLGLSSQTYIKWAVVCELIHSASLLHDDICDKDSMRRGKKSLWKEFGIPAAVCTGDYLIAESFRKITEIEQGWHQNILLKLLSCSVKEIIFGQSLDVSLDHLTLTKDQCRKIAIDKTAPLIALPMMGMFRCKELTEDECVALKEISNELGFAYQYLNDIENIIGFEQEISSDFLKGHPNFMVIRILENLSALEKKVVFKQPSKFNDFISERNFIQSQEEIVAILKNAMLNNHRLPIIIQPIIESLKDEIIKRLNLI